MRLHSSFIWHGGHPARRPPLPCGRRGFTMVEVVAAAAVTAMMLGMVTPLFARQLRFVAEARRERIALEELANQAERLAALPGDGLAAALAAAELSPAVRDLLPGARLQAARAGSSALGERIVLSLSWDAPGRRERPLCLVTWIPPRREEEVPR
jgi:prepilin-type N-terminal cleavage/methylation domain-containing protein